MLDTAHWLRRNRVRAGIVFGLPIVAILATAPGSREALAAAQGSGPCALLKADDIHALAYPASVTDGVPASFAPAGYSACHYAWGEGVNRHKLDLTVSDGTRMFAGMGPDAVKQGVLSTVRAETADTTIPDVGDAAVFTADSPAYVHATALVKGRILQVHLEGVDARDRKDQMIALLKSAAARL